MYGSLIVLVENFKKPPRCSEDQDTFITHSSPSCYITLSVQVIMPSAHRSIFCRKELREKVRVKVRSIIGVSQCTWTDFLSQTKHQTCLTNFYQSVLWGTRPGFLSRLLSSIKKRAVCAGHKALTRITWVIRKPTQVFLLLPHMASKLNKCIKNLNLIRLEFKFFWLLK